MGKNNVTVDHLSFKKFTSNAAFYYMMPGSSSFFEAFKKDVTGDVIDVNCYATTFRGTLIDFPTKTVKTGRKVIMKVTAHTYRMSKKSHIYLPNFNRFLLLR